MCVFAEVGARAKRNFLDMVNLAQVKESVNDVLLIALLILVARKKKKQWQVFCRETGRTVRFSRVS